MMFLDWLLRQEEKKHFDKGREFDFPIEGHHPYVKAVNTHISQSQCCEKRTETHATHNKTKRNNKQTRPS